MTDHSHQPETETETMIDRPMWAVWQVSGNIYGVGSTPNEARAAAVEWLDRGTDVAAIPETADAADGALVVVMCARDLARKVEADGSPKFLGFRSEEGPRFYLDRVIGTLRLKG
jgi:hypothetical protein